MLTNNINSSDDDASLILIVLGDNKMINDIGALQEVVRSFGIMH